VNLRLALKAFGLAFAAFDLALAWSLSLVVAQNQYSSGEFATVFGMGWLTLKFIGRQWTGIPASIL
jgi:hypothetical protein